MTVEATDQNAGTDVSLLDDGFEADPNAAGQQKDTAAAQSKETPESKEAAGQKTVAEVKAAKDAEDAKATKAVDEKRLLEAKYEDLSVEDKAKKAELIKAKEAAEKANTGAPETYADFNFPADVVVDPELKTEFTALAKELNLSQEKAQKFVDLQVKHSEKIIAGITKQFTDTVNAWKAESKKMLGADFKKEIAASAKALNLIFQGDADGLKAYREIMAQTGVGNHPLQIKVLQFIGKAISEDKFIQGSKPAAKDKSDAEKFYPDMKKQ